MSYLDPFPYKIEYPYISEKSFQRQIPFIQITTSHKTYVGLANQKIILLDTSIKHASPLILFSSYQLPTASQLTNFEQATKQLKGMTYKLLYTHSHHYLCVGFQENIPISFVMFTIDLNTKGYYEIQNIEDILKNID